eukprot:4422044-Heterocapsa_arctica.AAC.1
MAGIRRIRLLPTRKRPGPLSREFAYSFRLDRVAIPPPGSLSPAELDRLDPLVEERLRLRARR